MSETDRAGADQTERRLLDHYGETIEAWKIAEQQTSLAEEAVMAATEEQRIAVADARSQAEILQREATLTALRILVGPSLADLVSAAWDCAEMHAGRGPGEASTAEEIREGRSDLAGALFRLGA
jgi:hypothetical protein